MRGTVKLFLSIALLAILSGCIQAGDLPVERTSTIISRTSSSEITPKPSMTIQLPAATATVTLTATPTPLTLDLDCGQVFCQQTWPGLLARPFSTDYPLTIDPTYPYASTKNDTMDPHHGVEFPNGYGTPVLAAQSGTVAFAGSDDQSLYGPYTSFYGNVVILLHPGIFEGRDLYTLYGHLSEILVNEGDTVILGQVIGRIGSSGAADGPHLHFEVRLDENAYAATTNPMLWLEPLKDLEIGATSTLAGRIVNQRGTPLDRFTLSLEKLDEDGSVEETYYPITYFPAGVNGNPVLNENFVMPDLPPGDYRLALIYGAYYKVEFTLEPGSLGLINLQLD